MEPMRVIWAGVIVVVQPPSGTPPQPWPQPGTTHDLVLHQVSAWLNGLRQGVQAAPPLPAFTPQPVRSEPEPDEREPSFPGFYL
jgi:hypothetical protein